MTAQSTFTYVQSNGTLTLDGLKLFRAMEARFDALEGKLQAIAEVAAPTGGATTDAEARAAILAIIAATA